MLYLWRDFSKTLARLTFVFMVGFVFTSSNHAQAEVVDVLEINTSCEINIFAIEGVMRRSIDENGRIFIISHRSRLEQKGVDWARLKYTRTAMTKFRQFPSDKVIIAVGEPTEEKHGKLEFWVGSKLQLTVYIKSNQQVCFHI